MQPIRRMVLEPTLSLTEADRKFKGAYLDRGHYDFLVADTVLGELRSGEPKFLFLRNVLRQECVRMIWARLRGLPFKKGRRFHSFALQGSKGGETVMGWVEDVQPGGRQLRLTRPTTRHPLEYGFTIMPMCGLVGSLIKDYLPKYWREQQVLAKRNGEKVIGPVWRDTDNVWAIGDDGRRTKLTMQNTDYPIFSTVTINHSLIFPAHADAKNKNGLAFLMAFGRFAGGDLCLPRLRVAFRLRPGDVLIADNNREQHGNIGPLAGERISVVGYLKDLGKEFRDPAHETEGRGQVGDWHPRASRF